MRYIIIGLVAALLFPTSSNAWSRLGHRVSCAIAYQMLEDEERTEVDRLTALYRRPDGKAYKYFTQGCTLADLARERAGKGEDGWSRFAQFDRWHYYNVPRETVRVKSEDCARDCVLHAISHHLSILGDGDEDDQTRAEALFLLGHWVADIHQPLHVSFEDDRGGNLVRLIRGGFYDSDNLHSLWDVEILGKIPMEGGWWAYAGGLRKAIPESLVDEWTEPGPLGWAQESFDLTTTADLRYCQREKAGSPCTRIEKQRDLDRDYQTKFAGEIELRMQKAGARLASLIQGALASKE